MNISTPYFEKINNDENHIPLAKPSITKKEISYVNDAIINGWGDNKNSYIEKFERSFHYLSSGIHNSKHPKC